MITIELSKEDAINFCKYLEEERVLKEEYRFIWYDIYTQMMRQITGIQNAMPKVQGEDIRVSDNEVQCRASLPQVQEM